MRKTSTWGKRLAALLLAAVLGAVSGCEQEETATAADEQQSQKPACCCEMPSRNQAVSSPGSDECCEEECKHNPEVEQPEK